MIQNFIDEDYLKGYSPKIISLLFTGETDYSKQKDKATERVLNTLGQTYDLRNLMPELSLRASGTSISATTLTDEVEDSMNRRRVVIDKITNETSTKTVTLQGSDDGTNYVDVRSLEVLTSDTIVSSSFYETFKYYRVSVPIVSGTIDFRARLVETTYDELFACLWLWFIMISIRKAEGDQFDLMAKEYYMMYEHILAGVKIYIDSDNDGEPDEVSQQSSITMMK